MWMGPDQSTLSDGPRMQITHTEDGVVTLQLHGVTPSQQGEYVCISNNEVGSESATAVLSVIGKKYF